MQCVYCWTQLRRYPRSFCASKYRSGTTAETSGLSNSHPPDVVPAQQSATFQVSREAMNALGRRVSAEVRKGLKRVRVRVFSVLAVAGLVICGVCTARASVALLLEEPFGQFGAMNPTGHAAVYLSHVCAEGPTHLRMCLPGEYGAVISRYHKIDGYDWIAMPLIPYLYAVDDPAQIPAWVDSEQVVQLRDTYRRAHLQALAPDSKKGTAPKGEWIQLIGSSYDRKIYGFELGTTAQQDERFVALFNDRKDVSHFNLFSHNCADFSRVVLDTYIPDVVHRNFIADVGLTTPKQVARSLVKYGDKRPEVDVSAFVIPQVEGTVKRSHPVNGVAESLVKSKKYLIPMAVLTPHVMATVAVAYVVDGRFKIPKDVPEFDVNEAAVKPEEVVPVKDVPDTIETATGGTGEGPSGGPAAPGRTSALRR